jgi:hypothetical protein
MNFIKCHKCGREEPAFDYAHICGPVEVKQPNKRIELTRPDGTPYLTLRKDSRLAYIQIHDYDYFGDPVEFNFDVRTIPMLIDGLIQLRDTNE